MTEQTTDRIARYLFIAVSTLGSLTLVFVFGMWSGYHRTGIFRAVESGWESIRQSGKEVRQTSVLRPDYMLQPARFEGDGVTVNEFDKSSDLVLLSGFFGDDDANELRLIRRDGTLVNRWPVYFSKTFPNPTHLPHAPASDWNADTHGAVALPDGSVVFNFEYSGMAKLDRCGQVVWTLKHQTHHSVELAEGGGFWVPGQQVVTEYPEGITPFPPFQLPLTESLILKVSEDGEIVKRISVPQLFYDNQLEALLSSSAIYFEESVEPGSHEIVHINKVDELSSELAADFPQFSAGDLLLSMRNLNLLMVIDPETTRVKWWHIGPWKRQHDPEFSPNGKILVFNNNTYVVMAFGKTGEDRRLKRTNPGTPRLSNIIEFDPGSNESRVLYGHGGEPGQEMLSVIRGKVEWTRGGGALITESDGGRAFEIDAAGNIIWQFINRYDEDEVAELTEARLYDEQYFTVNDWACQ